MDTHTHTHTHTPAPTTITTTTTRAPRRELASPRPHGSSSSSNSTTMSRSLSPSPSSTRPPHLPSSRPPLPSPLLSLYPILSPIPSPPRSATWQPPAKKPKGQGRSNALGSFLWCRGPLVRLSWEIGGQGAPHWPNSAAHPPTSYVFHVLSGFDGDAPWGWDGDRDPSFLALLLLLLLRLLIIDVFSSLLCR